MKCPCISISMRLRFRYAVYATSTLDYIDEVNLDPVL